MRDYEKLSDNDLTGLLKKGNIAAFEEIYNRYWSRLYSAAYKRVKSREVCQEIIQDLFTSLWLSGKELQIRASLEGYLLTAVRYKVFNHIEKELVRRNYRSTLPEASLRIDNSTEETILLNDLSQQLEEEIVQLPEKCRQVFELSRKQQKSNKEIALELNISEKTVENHITKALRLMRAGLKDSIASLFLL
ncbi:RNA polymerase sigma-70 factor (ECF subfamily) [Anseongella ginsenosidimutans]|uniref:RNA polymerase sigma-70 factor (ECF subfamily) n=1 Tax=Anseongella ginsenosidimutans TaxID=496056 RepID=A0A4R3KLP8_9SPHI|nr:RNA polymerase sigma-70 factor [Anseongella ginsenosidimutans]QEC53770.1 RNA polymerase sigma-70 factor [Anseongella ginsenosidimutans]TCS84912.1 RNA polymerase sigma-70 factor (ECF subfamily) [Anseongella ginsenosidimutans]